MRRNLVVSFLVLAFGFCFILSAQAQLVVGVGEKVETGQFGVGAMFSQSAIEYEPDDGDESEVERMLIGGYGIYGLNDRIDIYGGLGYIVKAEIEDWGEEGNGFLVAAGARGVITEMDLFAILGYGELHYITEDYGEQGGVKPEADITELALGAVARYGLTDVLGLYGGVEVIPYSDGEFRASPKMDVERSAMFSVKFGADYALNGWRLGVGLTLLSEESISISGEIPF